MQLEQPSTIEWTRVVSPHTGHTTTTDDKPQLRTTPDIPPTDGLKHPHAKAVQGMTCFIKADQPVRFTQGSLSFSTQKPVTQETLQSWADLDGWSPCMYTKFKNRQNRSMLLEVRRVFA